MTSQEVNSMVESVGIPSAYYKFEDDTGQDTPFICFFYGGSNDVTADNINYVRVERLYIELYTDQKDFALEAKVEKTLNDNGIVFAKSQDYIDTERMHVTVYESDIVLEV